MVSYRELKEAAQMLHGQFIFQPAKKESSLVSRFKVLFS